MDEQACELAEALGVAANPAALDLIGAALRAAYEAGQEAGGASDWRRKARAVRKAYTILADGIEWLRAHQPGPLDTVRYTSELHARVTEALAEGR